MGFSPLVHMIERPRAGGRLPAVPRWLAILVIYLTVVGIVVIIALMVVPPLVAQSVALWDRLPDEFNRFQSFLIRYRILRDPITLAEAVRSAPQVERCPRNQALSERKCRGGIGNSGSR